MTGSLDAQTVRDALRSIAEHEVRLPLIGDECNHFCTRDMANEARSVIPAFERFVASVEALTSERDEWKRLCGEAVTVAEELREQRDAESEQATLITGALTDVDERAVRAEARVVALTAERKQELGGDGLGADAVAETALALQAHDQVCQNWNCTRSDGCKERVALFAAHDEAVEAYRLACATSPAHRRGAPKDESARLLSLEEALRGAETELRERYDAAAIACSRIRSDEDEVTDDGLLDFYEGKRDAFLAALTTVRDALSASVGDKEPPDLTSSTTAAKVPPVQAAPDSPREDASAPEGTAT